MGVPGSVSPGHCGNSEFSGVHKSTATGLSAQLKALARRTGWPEVTVISALRQICYGSLHDCLDAYSAAWVASLDDTEREPLGEPPDDVIWVPKAEL